MKKLLSVNNLNQRILVLILVIVIISLLIVGSAFRIQVIEGSTNLSIASSISKSSEIIRAPRGLIYDRSGVKLVNNDAIFNLYVIPSELDQKSLDATFQTLSELFSVDKGQLATRFQKAGFNQNGEIVGERVTLIYNIKYEDFLNNVKRIETIQGVYISSEAKRTYVDSQFLAHIVGYLGDVNASEIETLGLDQRARIGKDGIEKVYDQELRGEDGLKVSERSANKEDKVDWIPKSYTSGDNLYLTIDIEWQKSLYQYLEKYSKENNSLGGAAVIMEADTGKLRAMVNYPTYDLNMFAEGISNEEFAALLDDERSPLLNRSIAMQIPMGSTFKIIMASALQQEKVITKNTVYSSGCFELPGGYKLCEADNKNYGRLTMTQALARSSNPYFCQASVDMARKLGSDELAIRSLDNYFTDFGFGKLTKVDLPGEQPGTIPSPELKLRLQGENWYLADLCNTAIGQGLISATPIQMAVATSSIVNGGNVYEPQLIEKFENYNLELVQGTSAKLAKKLEIDQVYLDNIMEGMEGAADYGSANLLNKSPGNPIAKTGSSEATVKTSKGRIIKGAHSWVVGAFEGKDGKRYVFVVAQQFGGRGHKSVPVIRDFISCYYSEFSNCS